uniref:Inter-alpha-trypsin inhibitor heavy chain family member 6 n=1 Tax=Gasterosteus aculeatus aculeatus TaxID=481459 RepID=G3PBV3_GASAC
SILHCFLHCICLRVTFQITFNHTPLKVTDYHVRCSVVSRYAITTVQSSVWNQLPITKEAAFEVDLPSSAFISNFTITSNGKVYVAQVKERAAARKMYDAAKKQGKTAGLVATKEREIEKFRVAVSVPPGALMSFSLSYEELLPRRLGRYELSLGLRPGQPVQNLTLEVSITERTGISFIKAFPLKTSRLISNTAQDPPASTHVEHSAGCARVRYSPTIQQQNSISSKGLNADFIIQYDVDLRDPLGEVQVYDGYFVHYFAPRGLPVVPKDVIFVIDVSGSMIGTKIKQTKQAMSIILGDLREGDHFNIITFSDKVYTWKKGRTVRATRQNVRDAKDFVKRIIAEGWTNINAALLSAALLVNPPSSASPNHLPSPRVPLVIFLTDGEATIGVTAGDTILSNAKKALGSSSLFGLAFGDDADFLLLKRLALDNRGVARMVYEDADAALQLKGFFDEVASPLLSDIQLSYLDDQAFDITHALFPNYFQGSELVVAGRVKPGVKDLKVSMSATDVTQRVNLENDVLVSHAKRNGSAESLECPGGLEGISSFVRRLWAYFTIKELLLAKLNATDPATQRLLADKATNLSLKYNFVTPVTSLVVVKPDAETPTTAKPATAATVTTTGTTTATSKILAAGHAKSISASNPNSGKNKPDPPRAPPKRAKKISGPTSTAKTAPSRKTTTSSPSSVKTAPAPFSGKKPTPSHNDTRTVSPPPHPPVGKTPLKALKTAAPPAPGKVSTQQPKAFKTTTASAATAFTTSTAPALGLFGTDPALPPGKPLRPDLPPVRGAAPDLPQAANPPTPAPDVGEVSSALPELSPPLTSPAPAAAPAADDNRTDASIATFVSATFAPMPVLSVVVDGDPHFVVQLPKLHQNLCFTVDGRANDVLRLIEEPERGIIVDGHLMGAPPKRGAELRPRTYFDRLTISSAAGGSGEVMISLSLDAVVVEGEGRDILPINQQGSVARRGATVTVDNHRSCWIELNKGVKFLVMFHQYDHPSYLQMAHLGFYITDGRGLSASTQGLLGQFQHADISVTPVKDYLGGGAHNQAISALGLLRWGSEEIPVTLQDKTLKDTLRKHHVGKCWVVPKAEVERLLGHPYESYVVDGV